MALETFPWLTIGEPKSVKLLNRSSLLETPYTGGYKAKRPENTRRTHVFQLTWATMEPDEWNSLIKFWNDNYGTAFIWQYPYDLRTTGSQNMGGDSYLTPPSDYDESVSYHELGGPIFTVTFVNEDLEQEMIGGKYWDVTVTLEEV